jgi:hypothetical protein
MLQVCLPQGATWNLSARNGKARPSFLCELNQVLYPDRLQTFRVYNNAIELIFLA